MKIVLFAITVKLILLEILIIVLGVVQMVKEVDILSDQKKSGQNTTKRKDTTRINGYRIKLHGQRQRPLAGNVAAVQRNK